MVGGFLMFAMARLKAPVTVEGAAATFLLTFRARALYRGRRAIMEAIDRRFAACPVGSQLVTGLPSA